MYVLVVVLNAIDYLEDILSGFVDEGISGATILDSQGMGRAIVDGEHNSIPLFGALHTLLANSHPYSKTIFTVLEDEVTVVRSFLVIFIGNKLFVMSIMHFIYSGVVPQQPPKIDTPFLAISLISLLYLSGPIS